MSDIGEVDTASGYPQRASARVQEPRKHACEEGAMSLKLV